MLNPSFVKQLATLLRTLYREQDPEAQRQMWNRAILTAEILEASVTRAVKDG